MRIGNLGDLRVFLATVELGSLSKAARVLHLSLSAVSARLKHLEEDLGCRLVVRTAKGLELTDAGRVLAREAAEVEKRLDQLLQAMAPFASEEAATLRVAGNYNASVTVLPPAIRTFLSGHPEAEVEHLSMTSEGVVSAVAMGTVDVGVSAWTGTFQGVRFLPLETDRLVLVFPAAHPLAGKTATTSRKSWTAPSSRSPKPPRCRTSFSKKHVLRGSRSDQGCAPRAPTSSSTTSRWAWGSECSPSAPATRRSHTDRN